MTRRARLFSRLWWCAVACASWCAGGLGSAQQLDPRALEGDFNLDLVTGPTIGTTTTIGLGGAYTALGFGIDAAALTPAAYPSRTLWETSWFELDLTAGYTPSAYSDTDFDNDGESGFTHSDYYFLSGGARFTFGEFGVGGLVRAQNHRLDDRAELTLLIVNYGAGYAFLDGQLLVAASARTALLYLTALTESGPEVRFSGTGPELGVVVAPAGVPFRIGVAARPQVEAGKNRTARAALGFVLPRQLVLPAELQVGVAFQLGPRPLNRRFVNPHVVARGLREELEARWREREREQRELERSDARMQRALETGPASSSLEPAGAPLEPEFWREEQSLRAEEERDLERRIEEIEQSRARAVRALPRRYLLLSLDALLIAPTEAGVGLESFLSQTREPSGGDASWGLRLGAESEPIPNWLKLRVGSYIEPSRFEGGSPRVHATLGTDLRLFAWDVFGLMNEFDVRIGGAVDVAVRYFNYGVSVGVWH